MYSLSNELFVDDHNYNLLKRVPLSSSSENHNIVLYLNDSRSRLAFLSMFTYKCHLMKRSYSFTDHIAYQVWSTYLKAQVKYLRSVPHTVYALTYCCVRTSFFYSTHTAWFNVHMYQLVYNSIICGGICGDEWIRLRHSHICHINYIDPFTKQPQNLSVKLIT